jgi:hypothetical protein
MTITYPLTLPGTPAQVRWKATNIVAVTASPFTGGQEVQEHAGKFWAAEVAYPPLQRADAEALLAILLSLKGPLGTFYLGDPLGSAARGSVAGGAPQVDGTNAVAASTLDIKNFTINQTNVLRAGDYLQVGSGTTQRLYKNLSNLNSDGAGKATADIWPSLREELSDGTVIVTASAKGVFRLGGNITEFDEQPGGVYRISFVAVEAI